MKRFVTPISQDLESGANLPSPAEARLRIIKQRGAGSPRAALALSALSVAIWLGNGLGGLFPRIANARPKETERGEEQPKPYVVKSAIFFCATALGLLALSCVVAQAQQIASPAAVSNVPRLVNFSGRLTDAAGKPAPGIAGVTFAICKDQYQGPPLGSKRKTLRNRGASTREMMSRT
jgi:hypothetical protein